MALEIFCLILYSGLFFYSRHLLYRGEKLPAALSYLLLVAIIAHGYLCYQLIDHKNQHYLGLVNIFCMTSWLANMLVAWNLFKHRAESLLLVSIPLALLSIIGVIFWDGSSTVLLDSKPANLLHIFSGIAAISLLLLAALQASLLLYLHHGLKTRSVQISPLFSSLEAMEKYMVQLLAVGFVLMSISLLLVFLLPLELQSMQAMHKIILTIASWLVLATLIAGRTFYGWRGIFLARWSIFGVFLLILGYFGSKLVLEFILKR